MVGEGFGLAGLVVRLPLQLDEHGRRLLQVLVSILWSLEDDCELRQQNVTATDHRRRTTTPPVLVRVLLLVVVQTLLLVPLVILVRLLSY